MQGRQTVSIPAEAGFPPPAPHDLGAATLSGAVGLLQLAEVEALVLRREPEMSGAAFFDALEQALAPLVQTPRAAAKYLVLDMGDAEGAAPPSGERVAAMAGRVARLVLEAPTIPVAYLHGDVSGAELTLALACSLIVCEADARFHFGDDLVEAPAAYALLAQRIGFVRAERLIERSAPVPAAEMRELLLVKEITPVGSALCGLRDVLGPMLRRYNSSLAIFRAQRIAMPPPEPIFGPPRHLWAAPQAA